MSEMFGIFQPKTPQKAKERDSSQMSASSSNLTNTAMIDEFKYAFATFMKPYMNVSEFFDISVRSWALEIKITYTWKKGKKGDYSSLVHHAFIKKYEKEFGIKDARNTSDNGFFFSLDSEAYEERNSSTYAEKNEVPFKSKGKRKLEDEVEEKAPKRRKTDHVKQSPPRLNAKAQSILDEIDDEEELEGIQIH